ncbi:hypothetical protein AVEN_181856-1, partial [Araneus ventricosus]
MQVTYLIRSGYPKLQSVLNFDPDYVLGMEISSNQLASTWRGAGHRIMGHVRLTHDGMM